MTGPGSARVLAFEQNAITLALGSPGRYRVAVNWSPYWRTPSGCLSRGADGTLHLATAHAGVVRLKLSVNAQAALAALEGDVEPRCAG